MVRRLRRDPLGPDLSATQRAANRSRVQLAVKVLSEQVEPIFNKKPNDYTEAHFDINPDHKMFKLFLGIVNYLLALKGDFGNYLSQLLFDYYVSVYSFYKRAKRLPYLSQLSPRANRFRFETWIQNWEAYYGEPYWVEKDVLDAAMSKAKKTAQEISCAEFDIITICDPRIIEI